jgi:hypothetical protein
MESKNEFEGWLERITKLLSITDYEKLPKK